MPGASIFGVTQGHTRREEEGETGQGMHPDGLWHSRVPGMDGSNPQLLLQHHQIGAAKFSFP